jgi:drug/metabolite transporter (DMT)-like permease
VYNLRNIPGSYAHSLGGAELICVPFFIVSLTLLFGGWLISGNALANREIIGCLLVFAAIIVAQMPDIRKNKA